MVIARATLSTTTIPVAAERPPTIVSSATPVRAGVERQGKNGQVAIDRPVRESLEAGDGERRDEEVDQHEIGWKQPGRGADAALVVVLDHRDMELARQKHDREGRQERRHHPDGRIGRGLDDRGDPGIGMRDFGQVDEAVR